MSQDRRPREYRSSGLYALQSRLSQLEPGQDWTEALGPQVGAALRAWREDLLDALGGEGTVSPQQRALVEIAARTYLMVESVDAYILSMDSLVNKSTRSVYAVVMQRQQLADSLAKHLSLLGLERRAKPVPSLREALAAAPSLVADDEPASPDRASMVEAVVADRLRSLSEER